MSDERFRLGLVGCGRLAEAGYLPALEITPGIRLVAVADPDPGRRAAVAARAAATGAGGAAGGAWVETRPETFPDAATLLDGIAVDGLVLATPAAAHLADAERAVGAGVATLVEKPPAPDAAGAAALAALDPAPWVGFNRRFDPGADAVRTALHAARYGALGRDGTAATDTAVGVDAGPADDPFDLRLEIAYRRQGWGAHTVRDDALADLGPHLVDWARWISGAEVRDVTCAELTAERATLHLTLDGGPERGPDGGRRGRPVRVRLRAATDRPHAELVELRAADGRVVARHRLGGLVAAVRGRIGRAGPTAMVTTLAAQLTAFASAARGGAEPGLGTARDGHAAMVVIDAARAGAHDPGGRTPIDLPGVT